MIAAEGALLRGAISCRFGHTVVLAQEHDQRWTCTAPSMSRLDVSSRSIDVPLALHAFGIDVSEPGVSYHYYRLQGMLASPLCGPIIGGSHVTVSGALMESPDALKVVTCRFGTAVVAGSAAGGDIVCLSPPLSSASTSVTDADRHSIEVDVSLNGVDYEALGLTFSYEMSSVSSLRPRAGPTQGGSWLTFHGSFPCAVSASLRCVFSSLSTIASTMIPC
jgi:hypothetical protein